MADNINTNPFLSDEEDFIENTVEEPSEIVTESVEPIEPGWDAIAAKLLKDKFTLTALELHTELVEAGRELPRLRDFFSNPGNFERTKEDSPPSTLPRTSSIQTFDSLDFARYSDDGERQLDERVAVLEFELRKAQDTIKSLRASLTKEAEKEHVSPAEHTEDGKNFMSSPDTITTLEKKAINFLVNNYLLQINNKLTAVTFSEENEDQDFEDWDDVGLNISQPPDLVHLYRDFYTRVAPASDSCEIGCQTELDGPGLEELEQELQELAATKKNLEIKLMAMEEELITKDKEMLRRRGVAEGSESEPLPSPLNEKQSNLFDDIPLPSYSPDIHSGDEEGEDLDDVSECTCEPGAEDKCPACLRVNSPEVYRLDFTEDGDQSGELEGTVADTNTDTNTNTDATHSNKHMQGKSQQQTHSIGSDSDNINKSSKPSGAEDVSVDNNSAIRDDRTDGTGGADDSGNSTANTADTTNASSAETDTSPPSTETDKLSAAGNERGKQDTRRGKSPGKQKNKNAGKAQAVSSTADRLDRSNRKMSATFSKALKEVCFHIPKDNRIVIEVSKITDADQQKVVGMLGRCLPHIVPNVLLAKREELIPLIICTAMLHPDAKERDNLLNILFNLIKKPDEEQRQMILTGCLAFAQHVGPTRLEAELLPQCWEQISHKYMERRLLVAEACGALAGYLPSEIRSSLVLSMLQQMLQDDREADVREAVVRSLGLILGFVSNSDKYQQGSDLLRLALRDSVEKVVINARQILLPSLAMWAYELGRLEHSLIHGLLRELEELVKTTHAAQKSPGGLAPLNEGRFLLYVTTLQELLPFLYVSVLESGPYMDRMEETLSTVEELHKSRFPEPSSQLTDLGVIVGSRRCLAAMVRLFEEHIEQEWFEPWDSLNWVVNNLIPRLLEVVMGSALSFPRIVSCLAKCFYNISVTFGKTFVDKKIKPRFIDVLLMGEEHMDPSSTFTSSSTPLTTCVVPVYASGVLSAFKTEEDMMQLSQFLREALFCLSIYQSPKDSLRIAITELWIVADTLIYGTPYANRVDPDETAPTGAVSSGSTLFANTSNHVTMSASASNHELLLNVLWEGVVHSSAQVRATSARLIEIPLHSVSESFASTRCLPALVTLGSDPDVSVRIATIPALGTLIETVNSKEILEKVYMQLQSFLDEPIYREEHALHMELISTFARIAPNTEQKFRDEFMLPRLTAMSLENNSQTNETKKKEMALQLFEAYSSLSCCFINYQLVQEAMLPGLRCLKSDMAVIAPEHEEVINSMIKEYESKIETSRPADRSSSFTGSFGGSLTSGEDMKSRMMTTKANLSNLFTRKK